MSEAFLTVLPNLSIGVICIAALVYITIRFLEHLDQRSEKHELAMNEREISLRSVEKEVRQTILTQLAKNTEVLNDTTKMLERVVGLLNSK